MKPPSDEKLMKKKLALLSTLLSFFCVSSGVASAQGTTRTDADIARWRDECARADEVIAATDLDDVRYSERWNEDISMRWVMGHMVEEYARHNGHADLLRERVDGATGDWRPD